MSDLAERQIEFDYGALDFATRSLVVEAAEKKNVRRRPKMAALIAEKARRIGHALIDIAEDINA